MLTDEEREYLQRMTRVMQIIVAALAFGAASFFGVVLVLPPGGAGPPNELLLTYMAIAAGIGCFLLSLIVPGIIARNLRQDIASGKRSDIAEKTLSQLPESLRDVAPLAMAYQTVLIIRSALLEGGAFFALISYMIERQTSSLVVAGALILLILGGMPTRSKVEEAVARERREINELRQMGSVNAR
jgi:membrane protease YdiL (CAAX protease family)